MKGGYPYLAPDAYESKATGLWRVWVGDHYLEGAYETREAAEVAGAKWLRRYRGQGGTANAPERPGDG